MLRTAAAELRSREVCVKFSSFFRCLSAYAFVLSLCSPVRAEDSYGLSIWLKDVETTKWVSGAVFLGVTAQGVSSWDWGSSKSFNWNPEGWFDEDTGSGGADKLGHAFSSYALTNVLADRLLRHERSPQRAALSAALTTQAIMIYVEVFDGFSLDHGFSYEDVVMNLLGTGLAYARTVNPKVRNLIDFRLEYQPSGYTGFRPLSDYSGQTYLLALKLGGFEALRETPLRFLDLQTGYYTRGFSSAEQADALERSRYGFVGIGLNLSELLFGRRKPHEAELKNAGRLFFDHIQLPYTSARASNNFDD
jgi:hypothetical protein